MNQSIQSGFRSIPRLDGFYVLLADMARSGAAGRSLLSVDARYRARKKPFDDIPE